MLPTSRRQALALQLCLQAEARILSLSLQNVHALVSKHKDAAAAADRSAGVLDTVARLRAAQAHGCGTVGLIAVGAQRTSVSTAGMHGPPRDDGRSMLHALLVRSCGGIYYAMIMIQRGRLRLGEKLIPRW